MTDIGNLPRLVASARGEEGARSVLKVLDIAPDMFGSGNSVTRAQVAMALNAALFADLMGRAPTAARYVASVRERGGRICFDHGALRTIDGPSGTLPRGHLAFARILEPLGYRIGGIYPLPRLHMTGRAYVHTDMPEAIPQFFVSELHVDALPDEAQAAAARVFGHSRDPLDDRTNAALAALSRDACCNIEMAEAAMEGLVRAFSRQHDTPALTDYETLIAYSQEAAWIATEGNAFNHATDRVNEVGALAARLKAEGYPMKRDVEHSANGRVHQTAFMADAVTRGFALADGSRVQREVPGSFYEFITRDRDPATGKLDLSFDTGNATGIFAVTNAA